MTILWAIIVALGVYGIGVIALNLLGILPLH